MAGAVSRVMGTKHMAAACNHLVAQAAASILEAGGNAIDAGVAGGILLSVVEPHFVSFGGVAPIILYSAKEDRVVTLAGVGSWSNSIAADYFIKAHGGSMPVGPVRTVVPAAPDAWLTALRRWGTMSFGEVVQPALEYARNGFPVDRVMAEVMIAYERAVSQFPSSAEIYLPDGMPPKSGQVIVQSDLADTIQYMVDEEKAGSGRGREAGILAARNAFYRGDIAARMTEFVGQNGGFLTRQDLDGYEVEIGQGLSVAFEGLTIHACEPWCQGASLLQMLRMLDTRQLRDFGHNTADYIHHIAETIKLTFADREAYFGDPRFVKVPIDELLGDAYCQHRRSLIDEDLAQPDLPAAGNPLGGGMPASGLGRLRDSAAARDLDTSYVCTVDRWGNGFSATPSDGIHHSPIVPGLGFAPSARGAQSWVDPSHPSGVAPGKRPRLTPAPALARGRDMLMPFGTPGADLQTQAMLQFLLNALVFDMDLQASVEAPRFASGSAPSSFEPHAYVPGQLTLEPGIDPMVAAALSRKGHLIEWAPERFWLSGGVCAIWADHARGVLAGAADPRRSSHVAGR